MQASEWLLLLVLVFGGGPWIIYIAAKLATTGYLVAKKRFEERNSNRKEDEQWH